MKIVELRVDLLERSVSNGLDHKNYKLEVVVCQPHEKEDVLYRVTDYPTESVLTAHKDQRSDVV